MSPRIRRFLSLPFIFGLLVGACGVCIVHRTPASLQHQRADPVTADIRYRIDEQSAFVDPDGGVPMHLGVLEFRAHVEEKSVDVALQVMESFRVNDDVDNILIVIDSRGGELEAGARLIHAIETMPKMVTCVAVNNAQSEGFAIFQSCDRRLMVSGTTLMLHEPLVELDFDAYPHQSVRITRDWLRQKMDEHNEFVARWLPKTSAKLRMSYKDIAAKVMYQDWVMGGEEALKVGAIDGIVDGAGVVEQDLTNGIEVQMRTP